MFYFVPYWNKGNSLTTFDDTVNQIRMFEIAHEDLETIILEYSPQIRYFLYQKNLFVKEYWSVFDEIQNIKNVSHKLLDFTDIEWPDHAEFIYTPFRINVVINQRMYANISFGIGGQLSEINYFDNKQIQKKLLFDDRGFLSSIIYFTNGEKSYQDYLDLLGIWQVRINYVSNLENIIVNPMIKNRFKYDNYSSLNELIKEMIENHFGYSDELENSVLVVASNSKYNQLLLNLENRPGQIVLSFFRNRYNYAENKQELINVLSVADLTIVDTQWQLNKIKNLIVEEGNHALLSKLQHVPPYDARFQLGNSQQYKELKIFLFIQQLPPSKLDNVLNILLNSMIENQLIYLDIACIEENEVAKIENYITTAFAKYFNVNQSIILKYMQINDQTDENKIDKYITNYSGEDEQQKTIIDLYKRINIKQIRTENDIIQTFKNTRLIIDVSDKPNIYAQIGGISAGIPQINLTESPYVVNKQNGLIINNLSELKESIEYYLNGLRHWNEALVYSVQKISQYTNGSIITKWKSILGEKYE
ncbi:accessory Sec system protein Asp1 [Leuconostoc fallax]|uniref:Accessory Sec system protein Asp1 n=1 Tax=Leuconostoc fallax TaxID=1251 RepID=A0A4R5N7J5_9LACO|nr:accessory Sec system protein Asp1 [Leuconostoc fallax]MBU7456378.1 accessory Sec system protein Asp1 [Leuconostoc fallax]TDG67253.1 hypothetical protein C5L23_000207 [Leuconostoc fallax]